MEIIFLHGALGSGSQLMHVLENLSLPYPVRTLEFPGHGVSSPQKNLSIENLGLWLKDQIQDRKVSIFAYSMSGYVCLWALTNRLIDVEKLVCLGTKFQWDEETSTKETQYLEDSWLKENQPAFREMLIERHGKNYLNLLGQTAELMRGLGNNNLIENLDLSRIKTQVLLCRGTKDKMVSMSETENIGKRLPMAEVRELLDCPHPLERVPVETLKPLFNWLST